MMQRQLAHIRIHAPPSVPAGQVRVDTFAEVQAKTSTENTQQSSTNPSQPTQSTAEPTLPKPVSPDQFQEDIKEFARDMVIKQQQIEALVANLPGLNVSEEQQVERMQQLETQLELLEAERVQAVKDKQVLLTKVEDKIMQVGRVRSMHHSIA